MPELAWALGLLGAGAAVGYCWRAARPTPQPLTPEANPAPVGRDVTAPLYGLPTVNTRTLAPAPTGRRLLLWDECLGHHVYVGDTKS